MPFATADVVRVAVESGLVWRMSIERTVDGSSSYLLGFTTGSKSAFIESRDLSTTADDAYILIYEDVPYTGGTVVTLQNRKRDCQNRADLSPTTDFKHGVTATPAGAPITGAHMLHTNKGTALIGDDPNAAVIELKPNTSHVIVLQNADSAAKIIALGANIRRAP